MLVEIFQFTLEIDASLKQVTKLGIIISVQANMMMNDSVWPAMAAAYEKSHGSLTDRLLTALIAAQYAGGDIRGKQSAALLVAENIKDDKPWTHILSNLRVDDHPEPIKELQRLITIQTAYHLMNEGDDFLSQDDSEAAREKYQKAAELAPDIEELPFWQAVTMADTGKVEEALPIFKQVFKINFNWAELVRRLPAAGLLPNDPAVMKKILSVISEEGGNNARLSG